MDRDRKAPYRAFLLRCWAENPPTKGGGVSWRFSLEEVGEQEHPRHGFGDFERLVSFLRSELSALGPQQEG